MRTEIGHVEAIFRYPVKSMGGERLEAATAGWHGLDGDRRLAFRRNDDRNGCPWLTASKLPDLLRFGSQRREEGAQGDLPTHIRTPDGEEMPVFGEDLAMEVGRRHSHWSTGGRADHGPPRGDRTQRPWLNEIQCPGTESNRGVPAEEPSWTAGSGRSRESALAVEERLKEGIVGVTPAPVFAALQRTHHRMLRGAEMLRGVFADRAIAATDMAAA